MLPLWLQHRAVCINNTQKPPEKGGFLVLRVHWFQKSEREFFCRSLFALIFKHF